jgi:hypothetical protein
MNDKTVAILIFAGLALACILSPLYAQAEPKIIYLNKCVDESTWDCLNLTQAAKRAETRQQVNQACRGKKCPTIYSVDPRTSPKNCNPDLYVGDCEWNFGAWKKNGRIEFAAMPGCPNARWELEKLLRRLRAHP